MVTQGKYYTVMELAERVGVPRTTINDWLSRYAPYIDFTMQGKRRIYSENTLSVLLRISQLRSAGASSFQIEGELAASYAVHPETADEAPAPADTGKKEEKPEAVRSEPSSSGADAPADAAADAAGTAEGEEIPSATTAETALVRNPAGDPAVLLGERFREMLEKMDAMEKRTRSSSVRAWFFFAFAAILTILVGIAGFFAHRLLRDMEKEASAKNVELARLTERATNLTSGAQSMREQMESLQKGLVSQEKEFHAALKENRENFEKRREAELAAQKNRFAAERLELVRQLEAARKDAKELEAQLREETEEKKRLLQEKEEDFESMMQEYESLPSDRTRGDKKRQEKAPEKRGNAAVEKTGPDRRR